MQWRWRLAQYMEWRWWRRYLRAKEKNAYLSWKKEYWNNFLTQNSIGFPAGSHILDAGCGPAGIFLVLSGHHVDAVDPLLEMYQQQTRHFDPKWYPYVHFHATAIEQFYPDKTYQIIFCLNVINHVADLDTALDRLVAMLEPGGKVYLSTDVHRRSWLSGIFRMLPGDVLHPQQYTAEHYLLKMSSRGISCETPRLLKRTLIFDYVLISGTNLS